MKKINLKRNSSKTFIPAVLISACLLVILLFIFVFFASCAPRQAQFNPTLPGAEPATAMTPTIQLTETPAAATMTPTPQPTIIQTAEPSATLTSTPTPTIVPGQPFSIGTSVEGRPLEVVQFGNGSSQRMIVAGIHGGYEWNTVVLADQLIEYIRSHPEVIPSTVTLYILDDLNPDGLARGHGVDGRGNAHGVDLNRNWDANWQADWNKDTCFNQVFLSAGGAPGSEPEVQALAKFIQAHSIEALISYHSAALGIFAGGQPSTQNSQALARAVSQVSPYLYPPKDVGCEYTGQLIDWAAAKGITALDIELSTHSDPDLEINERVLKVFLNWKKQN